MLDVSLLRSSPEVIRQSLARRGVQIPLEDLADTEARIRRLRHEADQLRASQRSLGRKIAGLEGDEKKQAIDRAASLSSRIKQTNEHAGELSDRFYQKWHTLPNLVDPTAAEGFTEEDSQEVKRVGDIPRFGFKPADHETLGERLDVIDTKRAAKMAGSRFGYLKGKGALLEFGLIKWSMDHLIEAGLVPMVTPVLVREMALFGTGFFPGDRQQVLRNPRRRVVPRRHIGDQPGSLSRRRDTGSRRSSHPLRRLFKLFPSGSRNARQGHRRDFQGTPV